MVELQRYGLGQIPSRPRKEISHINPILIGGDGLQTSKGSTLTPPQVQQHDHPDSSLGRDTKQTAEPLYILCRGGHCHDTFGETDIPWVSKPRNKVKTMGDKSPKSNQKKKSQKDAKKSSAKQQKQAKSGANKKS